MSPKYTSFRKVATEKEWALVKKEAKRVASLFRVLSAFAKEDEFKDELAICWTPQVWYERYGRFRQICPEKAVNHMVGFARLPKELSDTGDTAKDVPCFGPMTQLILGEFEKELLLWASEQRVSRDSVVKTIWNEICGELQKRLCPKKEDLRAFAGVCSRDFSQRELAEDEDYSDFSERLDKAFDSLTGPQLSEFIEEEGKRVQKQWLKDADYYKGKKLDFALDFTLDKAKDTINEYKNLSDVIDALYLRMTHCPIPGNPYIEFPKEELEEQEG